MRVDARNLDIAALRPYVASRLNATLAKRRAVGAGHRDARQAAAASCRCDVAYKGTARLSNLHVLDGDGESDLLKWQVLDLEGVDVKAGEGAALRRRSAR